GAPHGSQESEGGEARRGARGSRSGAARSPRDPQARGGGGVRGEGRPERARDPEPQRARDAGSVRAGGGRPGRGRARGPGGRGTPRGAFPRSHHDGAAGAVCGTVRRPAGERDRPPRAGRARERLGGPFMELPVLVRLKKEIAELKYELTVR